MKICPKCRTQNKDENEKCFNCNTDLDSKDIYCKYCCTKIENDSVYNPHGDYICDSCRKTSNWTFVSCIIIGLFLCAIPDYLLLFLGIKLDVIPSIIMSMTMLGLVIFFAVKITDKVMYKATREFREFKNNKLKK